MPVLTTIIHRPGSSLPVNQGISHLGSNGTWLSFVQPEDTLDDREFGAGCIQPTEGTPVIYNHACRNHLTATIHCSSLAQTKQQELTVYADSNTFRSISLLQVFSGGPQLTLLKSIKALAINKVIKILDKRINGHPFSL